MSKKNLKVTFPVLMVFSGICYIYFTTVFVFIDRWFGLFSSPGLMNAAVFTAIAAISVFNYSIALFRDPGRVPSSFIPDIEDSQNQIQEVKRKGIAWSDFESGDLRFCQKCSHYKPPRAHHCRVCNRCILRMDHHCIWINNCVGHANYKVFFVFVLYAVIACIYSAVSLSHFIIRTNNVLNQISGFLSRIIFQVLLLGSILRDMVKDEQHNEGSSRTVYVISCLLIVPLTIALGVLLGWHIYLTLRNKTTIEYYEGVRAMWLAEKGGEVYRHPYDLGAYENLASLKFIGVLPSNLLEAEDMQLDIVILPWLKYGVIAVQGSLYRLVPHRKLSYVWTMEGRDMVVAGCRNVWRVRNGGEISCEDGFMVIIRSLVQMSLAGYALRQATLDRGYASLYHIISLLVQLQIEKKFLKFVFEAKSFS
ncbi:putative protein S-acyltransferase 16 [Bienertia sinuspersici]